jgi:hypothetical protein
METDARGRLLDGALDFVRAASGLAAVRRIAIVGSILRADRRDPKDIDLLVSIADDADLGPLATLGRRLQGRLQGHDRGADVFLADEHGRCLDRTCVWKRCAPGVRASCDALHCGRRRYLDDDLTAVRLAPGLVATPPLEVWPEIVRRCRPPADVEDMLSRLHGRADGRAPRVPS